MKIEGFWMAFWCRDVLRAPADAGATGGDDTAPDAGGAGDPPAAAGADTVPGGAGDPPAAAEPAWWEGKRFEGEARAQLEALGLTTEDPLDAVVQLTKMELAAKKKFGKSPDQLLDRPAEGQDAGEWLRQHGDLFGVPDKPDGYKIDKPDDWAKDMPWDDALEAQARAAGHELGLSQSQLAGMTAVYAKHVSGMFGAAETDAGAANDALRTALQSDWGDEYDAKVSQAQLAASAVADAAGIDGDGLRSLGDLLAGKVGDAQAIKLFAAIGDMMGEDTLQLNKGQGNTLGVTPADARSELQAMMAADSPYQKAAAAKRQGKPSPDFDRLHKRYGELNRLAAKR